jgi:hypothetical protein
MGSLSKTGGQPREIFCSCKRIALDAAAQRLFRCVVLALLLLFQQIFLRRG